MLVDPKEVRLVFFARIIESTLWKRTLSVSLPIPIESFRHKLSEVTQFKPFYFDRYRVAKHAENRESAKACLQKPTLGNSNVASWKKETPCFSARTNACKTLWKLCKSKKITTLTQILLNVDAGTDWGWSYFASSRFFPTSANVPHHSIPTSESLSNSQKPLLNQFTAYSPE